jgi:hypothetical protein
MRCRDTHAAFSTDIVFAEHRCDRAERPCLVDGGFPRSGPQEDLTTTCLTSLFCVHAEHTQGSAPYSGACGAPGQRARHMDRGSQGSKLKLAGYRQATQRKMGA